ncbi:MAG TPA: DNA gyrase inhibitor YacG [Terriglobales bacterium]
MAKRAIKLCCPTCRKPVKNRDPEFPFCSPRCRLIDLGKWASGDYVISSPLRDTSDNVSDADPDDRNKE